MSQEFKCPKCPEEITQEVHDIVGGEIEDRCDYTTIQCPGCFIKLTIHVDLSVKVTEGEAP
jgi:hypothetical protein